MINECAKFRGDTPTDKNVKFNLISVIELSEMADFVYRSPTKAGNLGLTLDHLFL